MSDMTSVYAARGRRHTRGLFVKALIAVAVISGLAGCGGSEHSRGGTSDSGSSSADAVLSLRWSRADPDPTGADEIMRSVVAAGPGFVAVGEAARPVWISEDGSAWRPAPVQPERGEASYRVLTDVVPSRFGLVAVGWELISGSSSRSLAWISDDGLSWKSARRGAFGDEASGSTVEGVAASRSGLVVVGGDGGGRWECCGLDLE